ncbi:hypothetical protein E2562_037354 [Oryza meyeriana var. granulata]|uniref:Serine hydrolase domain-containing protein n=1 Tax=Oryza meyeriana var. granulata TaxID=110450 RepID=A0A6G1C9Y2_9ORYZ|nr:hypothetical protein E2562_037354 [Oryza meyeriana var. granulata]
MRKQVVGKWPADVTERLDLVFADAPFPAEGKSDVEGIFDPPYYEWFQFDKNFTEYRNFDKCLNYIEELMIKEGPFDGLMGFSQGSILSGALPGLQEQGLALTRVPKIKYLIIIGGAKFQSPTVAEKAYANKIKCPSDKGSDGDNRKAKLKLHGAKAVEEDYAGAAIFYTEAIKLDPADATLYSNRSLCHLRSGRAQEALEDANACTRLRPEWTKGYYRKGSALMLLKVR